MVEIGGEHDKGKHTGEEIQTLWQDDKEEQRGKDGGEENLVDLELWRGNSGPLFI